MDPKDTLLVLEQTQMAYYTCPLASENPLLAKEWAEGIKAAPLASVLAKYVASSTGVCSRTA